MGVEDARPLDAHDEARGFDDDDDDDDDDEARLRTGRGGKDARAPWESYSPS